MQAITYLKTKFYNAAPAVTTVAYKKPVSFLKRLFSKATLNKIIAQLYDPTQSDERKAVSAAVGVFVGITPIWGFQTIIVIALAVAFRLNKVLAVLFSHVSFPPLLPLIMLLSYKVGELWVGNNASTTVAKTGKNLSGHLLQYLYGSMSLAVVAAVTTGLIMFGILKLNKAIKQYRPKNA